MTLPFRPARPLARTRLRSRSRTRTRQHAPEPMPTCAPATPVYVRLLVTLSLAAPTANNPHT